MRRIFVVGCPRSGTTVVQALLARHPQVYSLPETYFFESLLGDAVARWGDRGARSRRRWYHRAGLAQSWGRKHLRELERACEPGRRVRITPRTQSGCTRRYIEMLDRAAARQDKVCWVAKTPNHILYLKEIDRYVPDARVVHVLREGMNVVASVIDADLHQDTAAFHGGVATWARRWNRAMDLHLARLSDPRHYFLCLEDLIADPGTERKRLWTFLGLDADVSLLAAPGCAITDVNREPWKRAAWQGIVKQPAHKVEELFGPKIRAWLQASLTDYDTIRTAVRASPHGYAVGGAATVQACGNAGGLRSSETTSGSRTYVDQDRLHDASRHANTAD